eukprot:1140593-Pelagomonas_calceolata.AAC.4
MVLMRSACFLAFLVSLTLCAASSRTLQQAEGGILQPDLPTTREEQLPQPPAAAPTNQTMPANATMPTNATATDLVGGIAAAPSPSPPPRRSPSIITDVGDLQQEQCRCGLVYAPGELPANVAVADGKCYCRCIHCSVAVFSVRKL